jgi:hypothetical protein
MVASVEYEAAKAVPAIVVSATMSSAMYFS